MQVQVLSLLYFQLFVLFPSAQLLHPWVRNAGTTHAIFLTGCTLLGLAALVEAEAGSSLFPGQYGYPPHPSLSLARCTARHSLTICRLLRSWTELNKHQSATWAPFFQPRPLFCLYLFEVDHSDAGKVKLD